jgi:hypothetical protein
VATIRHAASTQRASRRHPQVNERLPRTPPQLLQRGDTSRAPDAPTDDRRNPAAVDVEFHVGISLAPLRSDVFLNSSDSAAAWHEDLRGERFVDHEVGILQTEPGAARRAIRKRGSPSAAVRIRHTHTDQPSNRRRALRRRPSSLTINATAPSVICEALPAVTVPPRFSNTGCFELPSLVLRTPLSSTTAAGFLPLRG